MRPSSMLWCRASSCAFLDAGRSPEAARRWATNRCTIRSVFFTRAMMLVTLVCFSKTVYAQGADQNRDRQAAPSAPGGPNIGNLGATQNRDRQGTNPGSTRLPGGGQSQPGPPSGKTFADRLKDQTPSSNVEDRRTPAGRARDAKAAEEQQREEKAAVAEAVRKEADRRQRADNMKKFGPAVVVTGADGKLTPEQERQKAARAERDRGRGKEGRPGGGGGSSAGGGSKSGGGGSHSGRSGGGGGGSAGGGSKSGGGGPDTGRSGGGGGGSAGGGSKSGGGGSNTGRSTGGGGTSKSGSGSGGSGGGDHSGHDSGNGAAR